MCYIHGHVFDTYISQSLVTSWFFKGIGVPWEMTWTHSATRKRAWHNKMRLLVYFYVYLCTNSYVLMTSWCRELHGKRGCHEISKKGQVDLSLGTMGIDLWCRLLILCFWSFYIVALDLQFWFIAMPLCCGIVLLLVFMVFLMLFIFLPFIVLSLGNQLGKRKVNGAQGEMCGTQQVM